MFTIEHDFDVTSPSSTRQPAPAGRRDDPRLRGLRDGGTARSAHRRGREDHPFARPGAGTGRGAQPSRRQLPAGSRRAREAQRHPEGLVAPRGAAQQASGARRNAECLCQELRHRLVGLAILGTTVTRITKRLPSSVTCSRAAFGVTRTSIRAPGTARLRGSGGVRVWPFGLDRIIPVTTIPRAGQTEGTWSRHSTATSGVSGTRWDATLTLPVGGFVHPLAAGLPENIRDQAAAEEPDRGFGPDPRPRPAERGTRQLGRPRARAEAYLRAFRPRPMRAEGSWVCARRSAPENCGTFCGPGKGRH